MARAPTATCWFYGLALSDVIEAARVGCLAREVGGEATGYKLDCKLDPSHDVRKLLLQIAILAFSQGAPSGQILTSLECLPLVYD